MGERGYLARGQPRKMRACPSVLPERFWNRSHGQEKVSFPSELPQCPRQALHATNSPQRSGSQLRPGGRPGRIGGRCPDRGDQALTGRVALDGQRRKPRPLILVHLSPLGSTRGEDRPRRAGRRQELRIFDFSRSNSSLVMTPWSRRPASLVISSAALLGPADSCTYSRNAWSWRLAT
jgi:hypothetical protein